VCSSDLFEPLTSSRANEGAFRLLRQDTRDEILQAHGVPPLKVGIVQTGKLGGNSASEEMQEYANSIVEPGREKVTARLNSVIELGFGTAECTFEFGPYSTEDEKRNAEVDSTYLDRNVLTPNEVRAKRFPDLPPLPGGDEPIAGAAQPQEQALQEMQRAIRTGLSKAEATA
jgi:hypothetical protein